MSYARLAFVFLCLALAVSLVSLSVTSFFGPASLDGYWHLKMGADWVEHGLSPWVDHYSFTFSGSPITNPPVVFEVILFLAVKAFGLEAGFSLVRAAGFFATVLAVTALLWKRETSRWLIMLAVPAIVYLLQIRAVLRPEIVSYLFSVGALAMYFLFDRRVTWKRGFSIALLIWLWSLYHSSVIGYVIFAGFYLDCAIEQLRVKARLRTWLAWLGSGLIVLAVGIVNPGWSHPLISGFFHDARFKLLISENLPSWPYLQSIEAGPVLLAFAALVPVLALRQRRYGFLLIGTVLLLTSFNMIRLITPAGIVLVLLAVRMLAEEEARILQRGRFRPWTRVAATCAICIASGWLAYGSVFHSMRHVLQARQDPYAFPQALVADYRKQGYAGRVFNEHGIGGYLLYELPPDSQVYIDGRQNILYPVEHLARWNSAVKDPERLRVELERFDVDYIILRYVRFYEAVYEAGGFELDFVDAHHALFTRERGRLNTLGRLHWRPACWDGVDQQELLRNYDVLRAVNPPHSALRPFADLVIGYLGSEGGRAFFDERIDQTTWTDPMRRFAGHRMLDAGEFTVAGILFGSVVRKNRLDYLAAALAMLEQGRQDTARIVLDELQQGEFPDIPAAESRILSELLQSLAVEEQHEEGMTASAPKPAESETHPEAARSYFRSTLTRLFCAEEPA